MKWVWRIALSLVSVVLAVVLTVVGYAALSAFNALPQTLGSLNASGLQAPVTITRDDRGVPWIEAQSATDAYVALGYVHAQDRLFQMELMRRIGQGRLSEILGPLGLSTDKFMRTLGVYRSAANSIPYLDPETLAAAKAYADGVNAFLMEREKSLPWEFKLLFIEPELWQIADSIVWQKLMGLQLSGNWSEELGRAAIIAKIGPERAAQLWPDVPANFPTTLASLPLDFITALHAAITDVVQPTLASNIWVVGPNRTDTGRPYLANDPHLNFQSPNLWYLAGLSYPGVNLVGATVPGVPFHLLGHNGNVAWGFTTTHGDTQDLFIETLAGDGKSYRTPDGDQLFEERIEVIQVRFGEPQTLTVRTTRHGPVISDILPEVKDKVLALSATLLSPEDHSTDAIYRMARAQTAADFLHEAKRFQAPQQNLMFADIQGNIGYLAVGRIPVRKDPACDGLLPADGAAGTCDWVGFAPFESQPQSLNPQTDLLVNANNQIVPDNYPVMIAKEWPEGYRAKRIEQILAGRAGLSFNDMRNLQQDTVSLMSQELLPVLLERISQQDRGDKILQQLNSWDGKAAQDLVAPLVFNLWMEKLKGRLFRDELGERFSDLGGARPSLIKSVLTADNGWCDDVTTPASETCPDQVSAAWKDARAWLETNADLDSDDWQWGHWHVARFDHPVFGNLPLVSGLGGFSIATSGDDYTVNRGSFANSSSKMPFRHRHGAGYRAIYDLSDLRRSQFSMAGGQSGHIFSDHFADLLPGWADGRYFNLNIPSDNTGIRLILRP
jgi:penicillin amidase